MIYADALAKNDDSSSPADRHGEKCLNCSEYWGIHDGWACPSSKNWGKVKDFQDMAVDECYMTKSMRDSLRVVGDIVVGSVQVIHAGVSDEAESPCRKGTCSHSGCGYRAASKKDYGIQCPCGITPADCPYHNGT